MKESETILPAISVIVTVYDRIQYYREAIEAIDSQTCYDGALEIIVVSNVHLDNLKSKRFPIKYIMSSNQSLSGKIVDAVRISTCPILAFLEDDDLWDINKAKYLLKTFGQDNRIDFYHNGSIFFRSIKMLSTKKIKPSNYKGAKIFDTESIRNSAKVYNFVHLHKGFYNLSSIAIRKDLLLKESTNFVNAGNDYIDNLLFFLGITQGNKIAIELSSLTYIRIHPENRSGMDLGIGVTSFDAALRSILTKSNHTLVNNNAANLVSRNKLDMLMKCGKYNRHYLLLVAGDYLTISLKCARLPDMDMVFKVSLAFLGFHIFKKFILKYHAN